jgi:hypothetical protein
MHLFGFTIEIKRTHYVENNSVCPSVFPFAFSLSTRLPVDTQSATKMSIFKNVCYGSSLQKAVGKT